MQRRLNPRETQALNRDWRMWGRLGKQLPPDETLWRNWLILGGRGAGKTRAGAEWVKAQALGDWTDDGMPQARRIAIVGPTLEQARSVMIEGKSGLLSVHMEAERPLYEPSKRLSEAQFSALVSFAFNVGVAGFRGSSVLKAVNAGRFHEVPGRLKLWVKAGGRVLPGLERRRAAEAELFMSETPPAAGRGTAGAPRSIAVERELGRAGAVLGGGAATAAATGLLPGWLAVLLLTAFLAGLAAWLLLRRRRRAAPEVAP